MPYTEVRGNLFASGADAYVNTVNCVGAMGKGIALEFRRRYPDMFAHYRRICDDRKLAPGQILPYRKQKPLILNFAIKNDWKHPSKIEWIETCLVKFCGAYRRLGLRSVAFPWMGAMNGGLPLEDIQAVTRKYLRPLADLEIEVYDFDPEAADPLYLALVEFVSAADPADVARLAKLSLRTARLLTELVQSRHPLSFTRLLQWGAFGKDTGDKIYTLALRAAGSSNYSGRYVSQASIFTGSNGQVRSGTSAISDSSPRD
jgi:O-acetyl-ADP-ribose deacetylase (regulator of RNase III)